VSYTYKYPRPSVTVDCAVFGLDDAALKLMLIRRGEEPFAGDWALPGGFVHMDEDLDAAARRELVEETGVDKLYLEQLYTFGAPDRDPRGRVITVAYFALVNLIDHPLTAASDAAEAGWYPVSELPPLAFDHEAITAVALERLRSKVRYAPVGFELLPERFTLTQLQTLYETVLEQRLDKRNFRKKVLSLGLLEPTGEHETGVAHRAAQLYRFDKDKYEQLARRGFEFAI
jgi:8-oxo-dGTP diphosphatase